MNSPVPSIADDQLIEARRLHELVTVKLRQRDKRAIEHRDRLINHLINVIDRIDEPSDWLINEARQIAGGRHAATHLL